jgi:RNA polymerase sigma-70 factor (ECF subfamily)
MIALKFSSGMTNRDIAQVTGLGESNVGIIIYRAVKRLQELLEKEKKT